MAGDNYRFAESDSLLCYHGPMLYEAKCLKRRKTSDGKAQYFIHYKGWNSKWEEWVDDDRVLTVNTTNMNKMASLKEIHSNSKKSGAKRSITVIKEETTRNVTPPIKGRKRKHSEISSESSQIINVPSPAEPKPKKRGRPPKNISIKSESNDIIETFDTVSLTETEIPKLVEVPKVTRSIGAYKIITASKVVEATNTAEGTKAVEETKVFVASNGVEANKVTEVTKVAELTKSTEVTTDTEMTEVVELAESIEGTKNVKTTEITEVTKSIEASKVVLETEEIEAVEPTGIMITDEATKTFEAIEALETELAVYNAKETKSETKAVQLSKEKEECRVTETNEKVEAPESVNEQLKSFWILKTNRTIKSMEETEGSETATSIEETKVTDIESTEELEGIEDLKENKLIEKTFEETELMKGTEIILKTEEDSFNDLFTIPPSIEKIVPDIYIPEILRRRLAYDFNMTVNFNKILKFPEKFTIEKLIRAYICSKSKADIKDYNLKQTIKHRSFNIGLTIIQYFNILIHVQLLYSKEKEYGLFKKAKTCLKKRLNSETIPLYFSDLMYPKEFWHYVYSPTYLLRLFVLMPHLLTTTMFTNQQITFIALSCEDFLKFVESKHEIYFTSDDYK